MSVKVGYDYSRHTCKCCSSIDYSRHTCKCCSSIDYSKHTCKCCSSIYTLLRCNILYLYESFSVCGRPVYMEIVAI